MSELTSQHEDSVLEPDEDTLISALRNQDDIPILMDIVADSAAASLSQEDYLVNSLGEEAADASPDTPVYSEALIAKAISSVLEKRLPELVQEVLQVIRETELPSK